MLTTIKTLAVVLMTIQLLNSCNITNNSRAASREVDAFKDSLVEKQIDSTNYYISLPSGYSITLQDGIDFTVYYFSPTDTSATAEFAGGLYFGNFPGEFDKSDASCKTTITKSKILDTTVDWTVYNCNNDYSLQTIIDSKSGEDWNRKIHAFGNAKSEIKTYKLLGIFSTLRQSKK
ncbi:MAG: hypothetical protein ACHQEB_05320 [Chitinophagales bacterium]